MNLNANYTWSHCIGYPDTASASSVLNPGTNYINQGYGQNIGPVNRNIDVGNCTLDRRQIANVTLVVTTPRFSNNATRWLASGWTFATIIVAETGAYYSLGTGIGTDPATGFTTQRPNLVNTNTASATQGQACANLAPCVSWLNPAAFADPVLGTMGNMGAYNLEGPKFWEWDESLSRQFQIREGQRLELRIEAYNLTNSLRLATPGATVASASTFGNVTADATPDAATTAPARVMQFALKYVF